MYTDENELNSNNIDPSTNVSNTMYLMSRPNRSFKLIGSVFSDPAGRPRQVVIPAAGLGNWRDANTRVAEEMMNIWQTEGSNEAAEEYFSQFDQRENDPNYVFSNVESTPDGAIDVVAYIYRYRRSWTSQPITNVAAGTSTMPNWVGSGGGYYSGSVASGFPINNFRFDRGFLAADGKGAPVQLFLHEICHGLFNGPHNCGANSVSGRHFPVGHTGTGISSTNVPMFRPMMAAWERWHLGYTTPLEPTNLEGTHTFTIRDFVTTGDAIRVQLPFPDGDDPQYLWIENHNHEHGLDEHKWKGQDLNLPGNNDPEHIVTNSDQGIYMYVEDMAEDCMDASTFNR